MASITRAWQFCIDVCNDSNVGYSMATSGAKNRTLYYNSYGPPYYCDCSSLMCYSVLAGGFTMSGYEAGTKAPFSTGEEVNALLSAGWTNIGIPSEIRAGDIGHSYGSERSSGVGHTEMCYEGGSVSTARFMGAHTSNTNWADQVCINSSVGSSFKRYFRYEGEDDETGLDNPTNRISVPYPVVAAIAGNFEVESGINPGIWEFHDGRGNDKTTLLNGFGLGQWTNTGGDTHGNLYQLLTWLEDANYAWDSGTGQVAYMVGVQKSWQQYFDWQKTFGISNFDEFLYSDSTDIDMLTTAWCYCWEGISEYNVSFDFNLAGRKEWAHTYYDYIQEHKDDEDINSWFTHDSSTTRAERYNNAVMLFKCINNYTTQQGSGTGDNGGSSLGDSGTSQADQLSFNDFLMSMLAKDSETGLYLPVHIIKRRK